MSSSILLNINSVLLTVKYKCNTDLIIYMMSTKQEGP